MPYTVTRQIQWPSGDPVVELSEGGLITPTLTPSQPDIWASSRPTTILSWRWRPPSRSAAGGDGMGSLRLRSG